MRSRRKHPVRQSLERFAVWCIAALAWALVRLLPLSWLRRLGNVFGTLLFLATPRRQRLADENLRAAFGERFSPQERRRIRLAVSRNLCKLFLELFKLPDLDRQAVQRLVPIEGMEVIQNALRRGKGAIVFTGHYGNWEFLAARIAAEGVDVAVVARDASDSRVASLVNRSRESAGVQVFGRKDLRGMLRHLRSNGALGILPDQHAKVGSIRLEFLGRPAWIARGPATLCLRSGCALIPAFCVRQQDDSLRAYVSDELRIHLPEDREEAVVAIMKEVNRVIEEQIRNRPEQWLWLHNRWKDIEQDGASAGQAPASVRKDTHEG